MLRQLIPVCVLLGLCQGSMPTVHRIFVESPHNTSIVFEYANTVMPEGGPLIPGKAECLSSQLLATGLFSNVQIDLKPIDKGGQVDVDIIPTWADFKDKVIVREISIEGFDGINTDNLLEGLRRRGFRTNVRLLRFPLPAIRDMVLASARETSHGGYKSMNDVEEMLSDLTFRIEPVSAKAVRLRIIVGKSPICE